MNSVKSIANRYYSSFAKLNLRFCVGSFYTGVLLFLILFLSNNCVAQVPQLIYSELENPSSMYVTSNSIYVVEQGKDRVLKLDHAGNLKDTIGGRGSGEYEFSIPIDVDATNGLKIFVADYNNRRVQVFDRRGQFLSSLTGQRSFGQRTRFQPTQLAVNSLGELLVTDENEWKIYQFDSDYNLISEFRIPSEISSVNDIEIVETELLILDKETQSIHRVAPIGSYRGFEVAEGIEAFTTFDDGIWMIYAQKAEYRSSEGEFQTIWFESEITPVDAYLNGSYLFILTSDAVLKLKIE